MTRTVLEALLFAVCLILALSASAVSAEQTEAAEVASVDLEASIPFDPEITMGEFSNGLRYYIRANKKPEKRAQLWLVVDVGSVMEEEHEQGLAHFVEHMAFNGTKHFSKNELISYLESIGMKFGPEINAYTSFDETVYMLKVPTDSLDVVETAFQILEDWAHFLSFDEEEIDKERGVIVEEWRLGRGADMRMLDKQLPIILQGSRYAGRLPIGQKAVVDTCHYDTLRSFYRNWYRPELMAVIAIGDFEMDWITGLVEKHFASIPSTETARERDDYPVPDHEETLFAIATDPEATQTMLSLYFKSDLLPEETVEDYRRVLMRGLYDDMLNNRLMELTKSADPPFLYGFSGEGGFVRSKNASFLIAFVQPGGAGRGLEALLVETTRARKFGFTESEFGRAKAEMLRNAEKRFKERDKTESEVYAGKCVNHFLEDKPVPGIGEELELVRKLLPTISLEELNGLTEQWITDGNRVVALNAPEKEGVAVPSEEELLAVLEGVEGQEITAYVDEVSDKPLVEAAPQPADVVEEKEIGALGAAEWTLSNGVRVVLKPTDFKNDEIMFYAISPGGNSLIEDEDYVSAIAAAQIVQESGVGEFDQIELQKKLAGKIVRVSPYISTLTEGFSGSVSPEDMETMFQLVYLYVTSPREDVEAFQSFQTRIKGFIANRGARPEVAFMDTLQVTLTQYHHRSRPWTEELLDELELDTVHRFYQARFADASDFIFFFVGNFTFEDIRPLIRTYLGGLPSINRNEMWKDPGVGPPKGVISKVVKKGIEPKSRVAIAFTGPFEWSIESDYTLSSLASVMDIRLRERLREDMSATYNVNVWSSAGRYPKGEYRFQISFGCDPERVEELTQAIFTQIDSLSTYGPDDINVAKVREQQNRQRETDLKDNEFWLTQLHRSYFRGQDPVKLLEYPRLVEKLSAENLKSAAKRYLNRDNYVQVVLMPEAEE